MTKEITFPLLTVLLFLFVSTTSYCQDKKIVDSLTLLITHGKEDTLKAKHLNDLVWYIKFSNPDTSLILLDEAEVLSKKLDFTDGLGNSYNNRAIIYTVSGNFTEALNYYQLAKEQFYKNKDPEGVGFCLSNMAICYEYQSLFDSALVYNEKALAVREKYGLKKGIAQSNIVVGVLYFNKGYYKLSLQHYLAALYFYENKPDKSTIDKSYLGSVQNNIGNIYLELANPDKAIQYLNNSLESYKDVADSRELAYLYNDLGNAENLLKNYVDANEFYKHAYIFANESGDELVKVSVLLSISSNYLQQHKLDSTIYYANRGITTAADISDNKNIANLYLNLGKVYKKKGKWTKSISYLKQAYEIAKDSEIIKNTDDILFNIAQCYSSLGKYREANNYLELHIIAADSILNQEKHRQITEMEAIYENDKKTLLLEIKEADNRELQNKNKIQNLIIIIAAVIVFTLILFFLYRRKLQKTKLIQIKQENEISIQIAQAQTQKTERKRLANMLHDNIAHVISIAQSQTNNLIKKNELNESKKNLVQIEDNLVLANKMTKVASYELEFSLILEKNIVSQFQSYINRIQHSHTPQISFHHSDKSQFDTLSNEIKINIFSVFQEMLGNAIKYSNASTIRITLLFDDRKTVLQVTDNGIGFNYDEVRHGLGLKNMKERAEKLNGAFTYESEKGFGTKLKFVV